MWFVNLVLSFLPAMTAWLVGSWAIYAFVYRTETRSPAVATRRWWKLAEVAMVAGIFVGSVMLWIALAMLLNRVNA